MQLPDPPFAGGLARTAQDLRAGRTTAAGLVQSTLARIDALEPRLQAFTHLDAERALRQARAIDALLASGIDLGPLMGIPVAAKDLLTVEGMPTNAGSRVDIQDLVPPEGSFVRALKRAGCVIVGKTRTSEFALGGYNPTHPLPWNPCDADAPRMTGGSSHGSAVAMAAGLAGFTVGSDTGGSVRWPAALCGVVGFKASNTHWACDGVFPMSPAMDSLGIFAGSAHDAAAVEAALAGRALRATPRVAGLRLAWPVRHFMDNLDATVAAGFAEAMRRLRDAGAVIVEIDVPEAAEIDAIFRCLVPADVVAFLGRERIERQADRLDPVAAARLSGAAGLAADEYARMAARRQSLATLMRERAPGADAWISPTVPEVPRPVAEFPSLDSVAAWNRLATQNTRPGNLFDQCGISLPIQHLQGGTLPVGLQLCAASGCDEALLQTARAVEDLLGRPAPPNLAGFVR
jgi:aspartyl-tRNA(Asn)/glutamyl-tRNA(Gln) amidotransferase subunit A